MSVEEGGGDRDHSLTVLQLVEDPSDGDNGEDILGMLPAPRIVREYDASFASSAASTPGMPTPSYSNRSRLVACEYEEICSERWLPTSPTSNEPDLSGSCSPNHSTHRDSLPNDTSVQSTDKLNNSERGDKSNKGDFSTTFRKKLENGKTSEGVIGRIFMKFWGKKKTKVNMNYNLDDMVCRRFSYKELASATNKFSSKLEIGRGGFGVVYKGFLKDIQLYVAIKKYSPDSFQGVDEFDSEIRVLGQLRHRNLVPFVGWCHEGQELLLVYEFMPNMSLKFYLSPDQNDRYLDWKKRYTIVLGLASALRCLQESLDYCLVHRDIKPSNILLDNAFNARLSDFGLARIINHDKSHVTTRVMGTYGYAEPEYVWTGMLSKESDIYSFGAVALEIACGRLWNLRNTEIKVKTNLLEWVWDLHRMHMILEAADKRLDGQFDKKEMECLLLLGLWCCHPDKGSRPNTKQVIGTLNFETQIPNLPLSMPVPVYHSVPDPNPSISQTSSSYYTDSLKSPELSIGHTQTFDEHTQTSSHIIDRRPQTSISGHQDSSTLPHTIPAEEEGKCEHQVGSSAPTTTLQHEEDQGASAEIALDQETFNIGISTNYNPIGPLQSYQIPIINGFIASLHEILNSDPTFDEVLHYIKKFTATLVMLDTPLDDWNSLAQYVLQAVKGIDDLKLKMEEDESGFSAEIFPFINEIEFYKQASEEDADALENSYQRLHLATQEHAYLKAKYTELQRQMQNAEDACSSILEEVTDIETRRAKNQTMLDSLGTATHSAMQKMELKKEECKQKIMALSGSMMSKITSFSFDA